MRRKDIYTGGLFGWSDFRDGISHPGVALGPVPVINRYNGRYSKSPKASTKYLLLTPKQTKEGMAEKQKLDHSVEINRTYIPREVIGFVNVSFERIENGETIDSTGAPEHWSWRVVNGAQLRGLYPDLHRADVRRARGDEEERERKRQQASSHEDALATVRKRLRDRDLDGESVSFLCAYAVGGEEDPRVVLPMSMLVLLLDDGERS